MKIDKGIVGGMAATALLVATSTSAFGTKITISGHGDYRAGTGGEFNVRAADSGGVTLLAPNLAGYTTVNGTVVGDADGTAMFPGFGGQIGFETFCIEQNEYISLPGTYDASISLGAIYGGVAGGIDHDSNSSTPVTDLISVGTAFLYNAFAKGLLTDAFVGLGLGSGYTYTNGAARAADAVRLQNAIWYLEDEISFSAAGGATNPFLQLAFSTYGTPGSGIGNAAGGAKVDNSIWNVAALNLGGVAPNQKQDQLILHDNGFNVPDGGTTLILLGIGLGGLGYLRRKLA